MNIREPKKLRWPSSRYTKRSPNLIWQILLHKISATLIECTLCISAMLRTVWFARIMSSLKPFQSGTLRSGVPINLLSIWLGARKNWFLGPSIIKTFFPNSRYQRTVSPSPNWARLTLSASDKWNSANSAIPSKFSSPAFSFYAGTFDLNCPPDSKHHYTDIWVFLDTGQKLRVKQIASMAISLINTAKAQKGQTVLSAVTAEIFQLAIYQGHSASTRHENHSSLGCHNFFHSLTFSQGCKILLKLFRLHIPWKAEILEHLVCSLPIVRKRCATWNRLALRSAEKYTLALGWAIRPSQREKMSNIRL